MYGSTVRGALLLGGALALSACATTVEDQPAGGNVPPESGTVVDADAPPATAPLAGSAAELLPDLAAEMSALGSQIAEDGNDDEQTLARIQQIWSAISAEVEADRPELVGGIETTVQMSVTAVERRRPADADKAFRLLSDLVDNYTGDG